MRPSSIIRVISIFGAFTTVVFATEALAASPKAAGCT